MLAMALFAEGRAAGWIIRDRAHREQNLSEYQLDLLYLPDTCGVGPSSPFC
jgi:hypothetical protein